MGLNKMKNVQKWLVDRGGLMRGEQLLYIVTDPKGIDRIVAFQTNPENPVTYCEHEGDNWADFPEYNHECYVYGRRIE